jgi:lambda repressor-like predicted transcriptional regulator
MNAPTVFPHFPPATRDDALKAIARALLRIRSKGWSCAALGKELDCSADTIENASNERSLLSFENLLPLATKFPDEWKMVEALWTLRPPEQPSLPDRLERIERELDAIRREAA